MKIIGLMSGTSIDGIDAALVKITGWGRETQLQLIAFATYPYTEWIRSKIFELFSPMKIDISPALATERLCQMNFLLGELLAEASLKIINQAGLSPLEIDLIGSHGQTICHLPDSSGDKTRSTLQIGESAVITERTGITTVADFRVRDIAAGGMGAPLVPYADYILLSSQMENRAIQNIGGIANVTVLPANCRLIDIIAFDTGPGNMLIDYAAQALFGCDYDDSGNLARQGSICDGLLDSLMEHPYLTQSPPKTTGREEFGEGFGKGMLNRAKELNLSPVDILATLTAFTARSISQAYKDFILPSINLDRIIISGGGSHNLTLLAYLRKYCHPIPVLTVDELGIPSKAKEAICFALLANETIAGQSNNVPAATGARRPVVLGKIIYGHKPPNRG